MQVKLMQLSSSVTATETDFNVSSLHAEKRRLLQKNAGPAFGFMPDDGSGKVCNKKKSLFIRN